MDDGQIIVKRVKKVVHGHHGGSWKIAFADFAIAMMAFFLVLWLTGNANKEQKEAIAGYFDDPVAYQEGGSKFVIDLGGTPQVIVDGSVPDEITETQSMDKADITKVIDAEDIESLAEAIERERMEQLKEQIEASVDMNENLQGLKDQLLLDVTGEGLRIQIIDQENRAMFDSGSSMLKDYTIELLRELSNSISMVDNNISITGHTDALQFEGREDFSNWELSAERANAARRALINSGFPSSQVSQVVGLADSSLFDKEDPYGAVNRRIAIIVLNKASQEHIENLTEGSEIKKSREQLEKESLVVDSGDVFGDEIFGEDEDGFSNEWSGVDELNMIESDTIEVIDFPSEEKIQTEDPEMELETKPEPETEAVEESSDLEKFLKGEVEESFSF